MSADSLDHRRWGNGVMPVALVIAVGMVVVLSTGCCTVCPQPTTHAMAFGARTAGCPDDCLCVCPAPMTIRVVQGDKVWFVNTSAYVVTVTTQAGTFEAGDVITVPEKDAVLVTVRDDATVGDFDLVVTVDPPGLPCPGMASPRIIVDQRHAD